MTLSPSSWSSALEEAGCRRARSGVFRLSPRIALHPEPPACRWQRLATGEIPLSDRRAEAFLDERLSPSGPFKLIPGIHPGTLRVIADLPLSLDAVSSDGPLPQEGDPGAPQDPLEIWAVDFVRAVRLLAGSGAGEAPPGRPFPAPATLAAWLSRQGWEPRLEENGVSVIFQGERHYQKAFLRPDGCGACAEMALADAASWSEASISALIEVAREANEALRVVRLVWRGGRSRGVVAAQVHLGRLPVPSPWLDLALDALRATASLLALEVPALADPALAVLVLESVRRIRRSPGSLAVPANST